MVWVAVSGTLKNYIMLWDTDAAAAAAAAAQAYA
jgi:hypothetical protein